jgi:hypothetical protein
LILFPAQFVQAVGSLLLIVIANVGLVDGFRQKLNGLVIGCTVRWLECHFTAGDQSYNGLLMQGSDVYEAQVEQLPPPQLEQE